MFATAMTGDNSNLAANSSIADFVILKAFSVKINHGNAPRKKKKLSCSVQYLIGLNAMLMEHPILQERFNRINSN